MTVVAVVRLHGAGIGGNVSEIEGYKIHPAAEVFPLLGGQGFDALVADIKKNGLIDPVIVVGDLVLDGRNRLRACAAAGVEPRFRQWEGDPWDFSWSTNVERRHLEAGARAALRLKWQSDRGRWEADQQRRRESANRRRSRAMETPVSDDTGQCSTTLLTTIQPERNEARRALAHDANVSPATAQKAITVSADRELFERVCAGEVTLNRAYRDTTRRKATEKIEAEPTPLPTGPFRVIVADPPWQYTKRKDDGSHRSALSYPDMTTPEICALPVGNVAHDDSILWLWTTNAHMRDAYDVMEAWGFTPKTILTWAKDRMGTGDWLRGKTEHCILAVRGKPLVNLTNQTTLLHGPVREHSRKPDEFYEMVEALCPGSKVELFCRQPRAGWQKWGAETDKFAGEAA